MICKVILFFNFFIIPKHFFTLNIIEERKPLAKTARRPGWVGSNILLHQIPYSGRIFLVQQGEVKSRAGVLTEWNKTLFLRGERKIYAKGWLLDIMRCIDKIRKVLNLLSMIFIDSKMNCLFCIQTINILEIKSDNNYKFCATRVILILYRVGIIG
jgi:hypothetical protein